MLITKTNYILHFRGISHGGPSVRPIPLLTETFSYTPSNKSKDDNFGPFLDTVVKNAKKMLRLVLI